MRLLLTLGIILSFTLGCTSKHKANDMEGHSQHGHHPKQHGGHEHQHGPKTGAELMVATEPAKPVAGQPVDLKLMIHAANGTMVKDFSVVHEEKVHLVIVRDGLDYFAHIHPAVDAQGNLTISHTFPSGGTYRLFADYAPAGGAHATATGSVMIGGESSQAAALVANAPGNVDADGIRAAISAEPLKAGEAARVSFALRDQQGNPVELENYMGALGHLMFVSATGKYVHVHPVGGSAGEGQVEFDAHFPEPGLYKGWGQFKQQGQVRIVPFVVDVQ